VKLFVSDYNALATALRNGLRRDLTASTTNRTTRNNRQITTSFPKLSSGLLPPSPCSPIARPNPNTISILVRVSSVFVYITQPNSSSVESSRLLLEQLLNFMATLGIMIVFI
jgi:hypothetical protein